MISAADKKKFEELNRLVSGRQCRIEQLREELERFPPKIQEQYYNETVENKPATAMSRLLHAAKKDKAIEKFEKLLKEKRDRAFDTLACVYNESTDLFKTLFSILDTQQEEGFEKYLEKKKERGEVQAQHILKRYCYLYVKKLNKLIKDKIKEFREEFNKLSDYQKERYISLTVENEHAKAMCYILDEMDEDEAIKTFKELFDHYEKFASDTLYTAADRKLPLWRTLLNNLDTQQKKVCKKYSEKKNTKGAKKILKHLSQNNKSSKEMPNNVIVEELNELVSGSQKDKFQEKFKKLPRELKDHYYNKTVESKNVKTMSYILETKGYKILSNLLHNNNKEFTFDALYRVSLKSTVSKTLLTQLDIQQKEGFRKYLEEKIKKGIIGAKSILEHYFYPSDKNSKVNKDFEKLNKLANASKTTKHKEEFTKEFNMLNNNDQMKYIDLTVANQRVTAMFYILNASAESFISVFQSDKEFACNVLNAVADNSSTLFTELLGKLDSQQNKDYVEYLHEKFTKGILKNRRALKYYLNNKSNLEEPLEKEEALPQPKGTVGSYIELDSGLSGSPLSSASLEEEPLEQEEVDNIIYYESDHEDLPKIVGSYIELDSGLPGSPLSGASLSEEPLESEEEIDNIINYHELDHKDLSKTADSCDELDPGLPGSSSTCALSQPTEPSGDWEDLDPTLLDLPLDDDSLVDEASLAEGLLELEDELNLNTFCGISPEDMEEIVDKSPIILQPLNDDEQDIHLPESGEFNIKEYLVDETDVEEIAPEPVAKRQRIEEDLKIEQAAAKRQRTV